MANFDPQKYRNHLLKEKTQLSQKVSELKVKIGQEEGAMQSWSRSAQKAMEQDLEVTLAQLGAIEKKLKEFTTLLGRRRLPMHDTVAPGSIVTARVDGEEERIFIVAGFGDPQFGVLSAASPVGQALGGRRKGEKVRVLISDKMSEWEILKVE